jgi:hypothetical protein
VSEFIYLKDDFIQALYSAAVRACLKRVLAGDLGDLATAIFPDILGLLSWLEVKLETLTGLFKHPLSQVSAKILVLS